MYRILVLVLTATAALTVACGPPAGPAGSTLRSTVDARVDVGIDRDLGGVHRLDYETALGEPRRIEIDVRLPAEPNGSIVVWSHGGSRGKSDATTVGTRWGRVFTRSGVTFVAVAHAPRSAVERASWCEAMAFDDCDTTRPLRWDRSHDAAAVFDWVERHAEPLGVDMGRLVYGGHSAGSLGALVVAGATTIDPRAPVGPPDPRPVAFILASPSAAERFDPDSLAAIDRPVLALTGVGDQTSSTSPSQRVATVDALTSAPAHLVWSSDPDNRHATFNLERLPSREVGRGLALAGVMFVDAVTSDRLDGFASAYATRVAGTAVGLR